MSEKKSVKTKRKQLQNSENTGVHRSNKVVSGEKKERRRKHIAAYVLIIVTALITGFTALQYFFGETAQVQAMISKHLKEKYGKEFHVDRPRVVMQGLGIHRVYEANAHPMDDSSMTFLVESRVDRVNTDSYVEAFWKEGAEKYVKELLSLRFNNLPEYNVSVRLYSTSDVVVKGDIPSFIESLPLYKEFLGISVSLIAQEKITSANKEQIAKEVHEIASLLKSEGIAYVSVDYKGKSNGGLRYAIGASPYTANHPIPEKTTQELIGDIMEDT